MKKTIIPLLLIFLLFSCASLKRKTIKKIDVTLNSSFYRNQFTGFLVIDPISRDTLYNYHSDKYFTPASNTKIFTLYTALKTLPDHIPTLRYTEQNDTLYFEGTGDPSFLHHYLKDSTGFNFLKNRDNLAFYNGNFMDTEWGPGWSWDDFQWYYSPERNAFPVYGNTVMIYDTPEWNISPSYFMDSVNTIRNEWNRERNKNLFYFDKGTKDTLEIPFKSNRNTIKNILETSLNKPITLAKKMPEGPKKTLYGIHADSLYVRLMHESDNFIAEQLLILASGELTDTLNTSNAQRYILENDLKNLPQEPRWVDGSGLSRYNLFTPQSMVYVLNQLYKEVPQERLFSIFPAGGVSGTVESWYGGIEEPYIFAKSGSLSNNYCLSGYLRTRKGKLLIFSFMNNHFRHSSSEVKERMQTIFEAIREGY
ncbi:D-alanyl-D-alanine carboxypeptidase [Maribacter cobaltidurans]|uniref:D-alanyl-D-alanine carboxypeptidase n=1 Tax=Maribacter cobaltidurans TaxID=1178778 RepID=A0A223V941_9FLAO|nr:D-alanyl-D-alanine carboxypeptidase [Maribacter cobaltidurans]ASV31767.1 D-alanyl-D-alanine carboxypeptidase [Maribacter cobaltidurans]GGD93225.1 peptidase M15 [Maribacter cobaltidurans]